MDLDKIRISACDGVYSPREDSYMLAESVARYSFGKTLDLGTGTGLQGIVAAMNGCEVTFADIDTKALGCANSNAIANGVDGEFVLTDLFDNIRGKFNTIIFNPPYLPSKGKRHIALDGGKSGRELIERFLDTFNEHLLERHAVLLVESSFNNYENDVKRLGAKIVAKTHYFFEDLVVLLF